MFKTSFCAVPALRRVDPVMTSGPKFISIANFATFPISLSGLQAMLIVYAPILLACFKAPIVCGVLPLAAIPTTTSLSQIPASMISL